MANQQLYEVLGSKYPFGRGTTTATLTSDPCERQACTGTSGAALLTLGNPGFTNGDAVIIHQTTNLATSTEVNWEVNKIVTGGGSTSLTLYKPLARSYTTGAQIIKIAEYYSATINTSAVTAWNGSIGGILAIACRNTLTVSGNWNFNGGNGSSGSSGFPAGGTGGGFRGGVADEANNDGNGTGQAGEGTTGITWYGATNQGTGGGAGVYRGGPGGSPGAGGGHAAAGGNALGTGYTAIGGEIGGTADLTSFDMGGGGGGGTKEPSYSGGGGGSGGGGLIVFAYDVEVTGSVNLNGGNGATADASGGAGAGGAVLFNVYKATLGTNLITAAAGSPGSGGGTASVGRIRVNYGFTYTGTTSPSLSPNQNLSLRIPSPALMFSG